MDGVYDSREMNIKNPYQGLFIELKKGYELSPIVLPSRGQVKNIGLRIIHKEKIIELLAKCYNTT